MYIYISIKDAGSVYICIYSIASIKDAGGNTIIML